MEQSRLAGIVALIMGVMMLLRPDPVWRITEKWKTNGGEGASAAFVLFCRILGGAFAFVGVLLLAGLVH